ncbi:MAG: tetratricopeptide repeat protein [Acidimicrobiia bacterium]
MPEVLTVSDQECALGNELAARREYQAALAHYDQALGRDPSHWPALVGRAAALLHLGCIDEAISEGRRAVSARPEDPIARINLGTMLRSSDGLDESVAIFRSVTRDAPDNAHAWYGLGVGLLKQHRTSAGLRALERAIELHPNDPVALTAAANAYYDLDQLGAAGDAYRRAAAADPGSLTASNLARYLARVGALEEAEAMSSTIIAHESRPLVCAQAHLNRATVRFRAGRLADAWDDYAYSWGIPDRKPNRACAVSKWSGEPLAGKTLLVWGEQGVGDDILLSSVFDDAIHAAQRVILEIDPRLVPLFTRSFPDATVRARPPAEVCEAGTDDPGPIDYHCSTFDLAAQFRRSFDAFPSPERHLIADAARVKRWRSQLAQGDELLVGFSWRSMRLTGDRKRLYSRLDQWGQVFAVPGVRFVNVQYDDCSAELEAARSRFGVELVVPSGVNLRDDFDETAAVLGALDLVIAPSNATSQLAAAIGIPTWELTDGHGFASLGTDHSPWRHSKSLRFLDEAAGWDGTLATIATDLALLDQMR